MRRLAVAVLVMTLFAGCSSNELAEQGDRSRARNEKAAGKNSKKDKKENRIDTGSKAAVPGTGEAGDVPSEEVAGAGAPSEFGGPDAPTSGIDPSLARARGGLDDPSSDAKKEGVPPSFAELTAVRIQGLGEDVRFTMTFADSVPTQVTNGEYLVIAFGVTGPKSEEGFALGANCSEKGWSPYAGTKGHSESYPGTFEVSGNDVIMELPWSYVRGPRAFEWYASMGWYRQIANQTHWSFDGVPNQKAGNFPS